MIKKRQICFFLNSLINNYNIKFIKNKNFCLLKNFKNFKINFKKKNFFFIILNFRKISFLDKLYFFYFLIKKKKLYKNIFVVYNFKKEIQINEINPRKNFLSIDKKKLLLYFCKYFKNIELLILKLQ